MGKTRANAVTHLDVDAGTIEHALHGVRARRRMCARTPGEYAFGPKLARILLDGKEGFSPRRIM
jgi:hypothetical protein